MNTHVKIRRRVLVSGLVQGVYFRQTCKNAAQESHVFGSATNLEDGSVEVILEGEASGVQTVIDWCKVGPPFARVDKVEVFEEQPRGDTGFEVK